MFGLVYPMVRSHGSLLLTTGQSFRMRCSRSTQRIPYTPSTDVCVRASDAITLVAAWTFCQLKLQNQVDDLVFCVISISLFLLQRVTIPPVSASG